MASATQGAGRLVAVALPLPLDQTFTYRLPEGMRADPGTRVLVPFQRDRRIGWVTGPALGDTPARLKSVLEVLEEVPSVGADLLALADWISAYYLTPLGMTLRAMLPALLADPKRSAAPRVRQVARLVRWLESLGEREELFARAPSQREAYERLEAAGGELEVARLTAQGVGRGAITSLVRKGIAEVTAEERIRDPFSDRPAPAEVPLQLTPDQAVALAELRQAMEKPDRRPFLLHGITGSGKTLVYMDLLSAVRARGRTAIVLVPEISLTPQAVSRFRSRFGDQVAVLHSGLSDGERFDAWRALRSGQKTIAVGARSAIFAPLPNLGAIVVDEEHDGSYKQSESPRYNARDVAVVRARAAGAVCVLGSATPSLESWRNTQKGKFQRLHLPLRATGQPLPPVRIVDLRVAHKEARAAAKAGGEQAGVGDGGLVLSPPLVEAVRDRLQRKQQVILLLNRRGYSSFVQCRECGDVRTCEDCSVSLTFHRRRHRLICHHCRREEPEPTRCERCGSDDLWFAGLGTEQVERVVSHSFPGARIARMDVDTTGGKWAHHHILGRVERGEVDILLGTQMIAKGLDFHGVTLVGVVNADVGLNLPDFRASERTFQLISQVAGRTGRGPLGGEVIVQSLLPEHYAIQAVIGHDFVGFAERELAERRDAGYPPFRRLVNVVISSPDESLAAGSAEEVASWLRPRLVGSTALTGPAPAPIERLHGRWRWHFILRGGAQDLGETARVLQHQAPSLRGDVRVVIDRDPTALL